MTKLKKQVVRLKINHFLNTNKYILFYPSRDISAVKNALLKKKASESNTPFPAIVKARGKVQDFVHLQNKTNQDSHRCEGGLTPTSISTPLIESSWSTLFVKNKIAQKAISIHALSQGSPLQWESKPFKCSDFFVKSPTQYVTGSTRPVHFKDWGDETELKKTDTLSPIGDSADIACTAAFQGNVVLLGCQNSNRFQEILKIYNQPIGALYNTCILDPLQVQRLAESSHDKSMYQKIINYIKMPSVNCFFSIRDGFSLFFLSVPQNELLRLLQIRSNQLSST